MAWRRRRWYGGNYDVSYLLLFHQRPDLLSVWDSVVCSCMLKQSVIHAWWITLPDRSR